MAPNFKESHRHYCVLLKALDKNNNAIKETIKTLSSHSHAKKDRLFHIDRLKQRLTDGLAAREVIRLRIRRMKETIKNQNRHLNENGLKRR